VIRLQIQKFYSQAQSEQPPSPHPLLCQKMKKHQSKNYSVIVASIHMIGLLFANFQCILRSASWSTSQPIFFLSNSSGLWGLIGGARPEIDSNNPD
jgi:hypothetical protein